RFELPTPCTPCRCATRLRYAPTETIDYTAPVGHADGPVSAVRGPAGAESPATPAATRPCRRRKGCRRGGAPERRWSRAWDAPPRRGPRRPRARGDVARR